MSSQQRDLFGGAIVFSIPPQCKDVSDLRQVPNNQEAFVYRNSPISIIVEVLERVAQKDDDEAAKFHFDSLAHDNSATSSSVESVTKIPNNRGDKTPSPVVLKGTQFVRKFNSTVPDIIHVLLAVFRVESKNVDLVLSMNIPLQTAEGETDYTEYQRAQRDFETAVKSLRILDFDLFVG
ncbi:Mog1p/PsbP-like protein [Thelephora ganbajun]|uniref:Mog1p/PsbP-like protein n=1 Tax=Thelephora ganbajun TaxID=370292 RepID=A0ACB6ZUE2_THEGA|nr:Mog1p/PsbP-like protein [Thelephora ganbajun]